MWVGNLGSRWGMGTSVLGTGDILQENVENSRSVASMAAERELDIESWKGHTTEYSYKIWGHCQA